MTSGAPVTDSQHRAPARDVVREQAADGVVHCLGLAAVAAGCVTLALAVSWPLEARMAVALSPYALGLVATFACSAAYNMAAEGPRKTFLRRLDHAAIFLMIAGTYTPVTLLAIGGAWGTALLGFVWTGALIGTAMKLLMPVGSERASVVAYLVLGWVGVVALVPLLRALSSWQLGALAMGGLLYSVGVAVHVSPHIPFGRAIWHGFVLAAAACHFALVLSLATG